MATVSLTSSSSMPINTSSSSSSSGNSKDSKMASLYDSSPITWTGQQPLVWLTLIWFVLCASLVHKHNELIEIFFAFCACFGLAYLLSAKHPGGGGVNGGNNNNNNNNTDVYSPKMQQTNNRIKTYVGLVVCNVAFWFITQRGGEGEFHALSVATGYLAFDLWFSSIYCRRNPTSFISILEDAFTVSVFLVVLSLFRDNLEAHHDSIVCWITYKTIVIIATLFRPTTTTTTTTTTGGVASDTRGWKIHGVTYDLNDFVDRHPGGKEAIELGRGRDCTALFESYHPFTSQHKIVLEKYRSSTQKVLDNKNKTPNNNNGNEDVFYNILKERVAETLKSQGMDPEKDRTAPTIRIVYYVFVATCLCYTGHAHVKGNMFGSFLFGVFGWLIGALGHDAGHFSVSHKPWINNVGVWGMSLLCNPIMWQHQHTYAHHSHTNQFDADPDLHHFTILLRVHRHVKNNEKYKYQQNWIFVIFAYTFVVFGTCVWIPLDLLQTGFLYGIVEMTDRNRPLRSMGLLLHMIFYVAIVMICPFVSSQTWYHAFGCVIIHLWTSGLLFGFFSQVNHITEACLDEQEQQLPKTLQNSWAATQIKTSNNFSPHSHFWHILSNGLNLQIEHHLFPSINHSHLYKIAPIVEQTCKEYGVTYKSYTSWTNVMKATLQWLDHLADEPDNNNNNMESHVMAR